TMIFLFVVPMMSGFANYFVPLQLGARDMAFPRLNALSYWLFLFGGIVFYASLFFAPAEAGWTSYAPLSSNAYLPGGGIDAWIFLIHLTGASSILGAINLFATIVNMRAPGMGWSRIPLFIWTILTFSILLILALPSVAAGVTLLLTDRHFGTHFYDATQGGSPLLWQHLFWFFGHPEVYIVALPFFGIITEVIPVFSRKPLFGYKSLVFATITIGALSMVVWAHHMYATGAVLLPFFAFTTFLIAVPTGIKFFTWIGTMWRGQLTFESPMLFAVGFLVTFLLGGLTGILLAAPALDWHVSDTYFVVAHFHYVLYGTIVFATFAGIYFWFPKITGRMMDESLGKLHFWATFIGFHLTFLVQHWLGNEGMPRRIADYLPSDGFTTLNTVSSIGAFVLGASTLPFVWNVFRSYRYGTVVTVDDPWGYGNSLEWATTCPPPRHNFTELPRIRSERPAFELHYPHMAERIRTEAHIGSKSEPPAPSEVAAQTVEDPPSGGEDPRTK
ncbi:MAG: cbb3-type cytochrome c oxidase subunit I, partial [Actinomycetota bacterium]|nr:cbb3-type cytochrome c oxidase subunit I [Actinomycetota bacterium]